MGHHPVEIQRRGAQLPLCTYHHVMSLWSPLAVHMPHSEAFASSPLPLGAVDWPPQV